MSRTAGMSLQEAPAFRDLGGIATDDGRVIRVGRLFRSEALLDPCQADRAALSDLGLRLVCDLRSASERAAWPCLTWLDPAPQRLNFELAIALLPYTEPMLERMRVNPCPETALEMMLCTYRHLPRVAAPHLQILFRKLGEGEMPLLVHCSAGKDRTGFVVAMLLSALGVSRPQIYADYLHATGRIPAVHRNRTAQIMLQLTGKPLDEASLQVLSEVRRQYLDATFNAIETEWGSLEGYLREAVGIERELHAALRDTLLAQP
jgi:protein-tyrosine phosphatase